MRQIKKIGTTIHPTAIVGEGAEIGGGCAIGPYAIIEAGAVIGENNEIGAGCHIFGSVRMGDRNRLMRAASLGGEPQSLGYRGEPTGLEVGDDNWFGENTVVHRGTTAKGKTVVGSHLFMMNGSHIGHDVVMGDHVIMGPAVNVGGEAEVRDRANLGAAAGIHQFARVGELAMVGAIVRVTQDVLPFTTLAGDGELYGLNSVGIKRVEAYPEKTDILKAMYKRFCVKRDPLASFLDWLQEQTPDPFAQAWLDFMTLPSKRGYARGFPSRRGSSQAG